MPDLVLVNAGELVTCSGNGETDLGRLGIIEGGALVADGGRVAWIGTTKRLKQKSLGKGRRTVDARGMLVTPGFVDPHSHLAFAGSREGELEMKAEGESYISILERGGGIRKTVRETRAASARQIAEQSLERVKQLIANGVTTVEVKTGYGQRAGDELKMLRAIGSLREMSGIDVVPTFMGLHATPPEFDRTGDYVDYAMKEMLPRAARSNPRPAFSDCFCEEGIFSPTECERYLSASRALGLKLKVHADEFSDSGGARLAARMACVSADHLGRSDAEGIRGMAEKGVVAVLLPGTSLYSSIPYADGKGIARAGCAVALGTDLSPNSWVESPQLVMSLACAGMKLTPAQALLGFTANAAKALSMGDVGSLRVGSRADLVVHSVPGHRFLPYRVGGSYVSKVIKGGREVYSKDD
jgi:imidazolonepropionase